MAQEARRLAHRIKQEEEASQWSGIPIKQLLNNSFMEQLNCIQSLQQIAPLHAVKEHLPKDIITILERLAKVDNVPFDKFIIKLKITQIITTPVLSKHSWKL